jgi:hypothetical protein
MEDNQRTNKRKADEGEEGAQNTGAGEAGGAAQEGQQQKQQNDLEPPATKRARTDDEQERRRAGKGKQKDDDDHDGGYARRPVERHQDEAHVTMGEGGGHGGDNDEERAMELERQREGEEEDRRAARRATSRFQQTFREDAEFGRLDYTNVGDRKRGDQEALEGEKEARGEASLADEQAHGSGYTLKGKEVPIEPFNLSEDLEMGYFDATGNFVFTRRDKCVQSGSCLVLALLVRGVRVHIELSTDSWLGGGRRTGTGMTTTTSVTRWATCPRSTEPTRFRPTLGCATLKRWPPPARCPHVHRQLHPSPRRRYALT